MAAKVLAPCGSLKGEALKVRALIGKPAGAVAEIVGVFGMAESAVLLFR